MPKEVKPEGGVSKEAKPENIFGQMLNPSGIKKEEIND